MRTPPFPVMIDFERIRSDLEEFTTEIDREYYLNGAGLKDKLESSRIYRKFSHLFNRDTIDQVYEYGKTVKGEDERRLRYLRAFLVSDYMENRVKELSDKFLTEESGAIVDVEGETMSFRQSAIAMANELDGGRARVSFDARKRGTARKAPQRLGPPYSNTWSHQAGHHAKRWPRRLRYTLPRGRPRTASRDHESRPTSGIPVSWRQVSH